MFMNYNNEYGITNSYQLKRYKIGYLNSYKMKLSNHYTPHTGTAIADKKNLAFIKSFNEFLERFSLGLGSYDQNNNYIGYGKNQKYGSIDTTGTSSGSSSERIITKAKLELIEKNEVLFFWYAKNSNHFLVYQNHYIKNLRNSLDFIGEDHYLFYTRNISNIPTFISMTFKRGLLTGCGIACDLNTKAAIENAILENRLIEWQNYRNPNSALFNNAQKYKKEIYKFVINKINYKKICEVDYVTYEQLETCGWIKEFEIVILGLNEKLGIKTIKVLSENLLNCIPNNKNIRLSQNQDIISKIYFQKAPDCILV